MNPGPIVSSMPELRPPTGIIEVFWFSQDVVSCNFSRGTSEMPEFHKGILPGESIVIDFSIRKDTSSISAYFAEITDIVGRSREWCLFHSFLDSRAPLAGDPSSGTTAAPAADRDVAPPTLRIPLSSEGARADGRESLIKEVLIGGFVFSDHSVHDE